MVNGGYNKFNRVHKISTLITGANVTALVELGMWSLNKYAHTQLSINGVKYIIGVCFVELGYRQ